MSVGGICPMAANASGIIQTGQSRDSLQISKAMHAHGLIRIVARGTATGGVTGWRHG